MGWRVLDVGEEAVDEDEEEAVDEEAVDEEAVDEEAVDEDEDVEGVYFAFFRESVHIKQEIIQHGAAMEIDIPGL